MWRKVVAPTASVSVLWLAAGAATICYTNWVSRSHTKDLQEKFATIQAADAMQDVLWRLQATVMEVAERADGHTRIEVTEMEDAFARHLAEAQARSSAPEAAILTEAIREQFSRYRDSIHRRLDAGPGKAAENSPPVELARSAHEIARSCQRLLQVNEQHISEATAQRGRHRVAFDRIILALWIVGPAVGILWGVWIARGLSRSISQISVNLKDAATGLEQDVGVVDVQPSEDLPALHAQVQRVASRIRDVVEQLQQARRETMLADRLAAVGGMAAGVAHELRNPLTSIKLLIQAAPTDAPLSEEHSRVIREQIARMENTIQSLLDFARPPEMRRIRHDLRDTLRRALNLVEGHAKQQGVEVLVDWPSAAVVVDADPEQLHQVFVNLLLNGIEAMPGGGRLCVCIECGASEAGACRVSFCDAGPGIPPQIMEKLFEPFVTTKETGTGLGLAISRRIVQQHGGTLAARNREVGGAAFTVMLPMDKDDAARTNPARLPPPGPAEATAPRACAAV